MIIQLKRYIGGRPSTQAEYLELTERRWEQLKDKCHEQVDELTIGLRDEFGDTYSLTAIVSTNTPVFIQKILDEEK